MNGIKSLLTAAICAALINAPSAFAAPIHPQCPDDDYGCLINLINRLSEGAGLPSADTLYRALDSAGRLDAHELLRYGRVKSLLGDYRAAARIYCRVALDDRRIEHAAMTQMGQHFADADSADKASALGEFRRCALSNPASDTAFFRNWIADFYGRHGLFDAEIAILSELNVPSSPSGRKLADAARGHFSKRRYRHAVNGAVAAYGRLDEKEQRNGAAFVAYQAYMQLGVRDSALAWLRLSEVAGKDARVQAAALNQETGHLEQAAELIDSLPPSLSKDTLAVRQLLFSGEPAKALGAITASKSAAWVMAPRERLLWRGRCMVFGGQPYEAVPVLDSLRFVPSWHAASEVLRYKYWIQKLEDDRDALELLGRLELLIYIDDLDGAAREVRRYRGMLGEAGEMLAVRLARALAKSARFTEAIDILELANREKDYGIKGIARPEGESGKPAHSPEYLYVKAETLHEAGRREEARVIARKILADYPGDVFAQKARILLMRI